MNDGHKQEYLAYTDADSLLKSSKLLSFSGVELSVFRKKTRPFFAQQ